MAIYQERSGSLEVLAVIAYLFCVFVSSTCVVALLLYWCITSNTGCICTLLYCIYVYLDRNTCETGGARLDWFRNLAWWKYFKSYFPVTLHKTENLPANKNYLLAVVPHGIVAMGAFSAFGTDVHQFNNVFPGLNSYLCTLNILFFLPFLRDLMRMCGIVSCSRKSVNWILGSSKAGNAAVLVVGGASEALHNQPGVYKTVLNRRKGFCRLALENGASLVPVVAFGEVDLYDIKIVGGELGWFQEWIKTKVGFIPMRFSGEGFLGLLPKRVALHMVVGSPIEVKRNVNATKEQVDLLHETFSKSLVRLFESEKHKYLKHSNTQLQFV